MLAQTFKAAAAFLLSCLFFMGSCRSGSSDMAAYVEDPDNGFHKKIRAGEFDYDIQYKPAAYMALQHPGQQQAKAGNTVWYAIKIGVEGSQVNPLKHEADGLEEYNQRLQYFLTQAATRFHFYYGGEELPGPASYIFENNYTVTPFDVMLVAFTIPDPVPRKEMKLVYEDGLFQSGIVKCTIEAEELARFESRY